MPLFEIPESPNYSLSRAPLVQALAQVRYPLIADLATIAGVAPFHAHVKDVFPYLEQERIQEFALMAGPAGPAAGATESSTWKVSGGESAPSIMLGTGTATLSAGSNYTNAKDFGALFGRMLDALVEVGVTRCDRLGVRYLSVAPSAPGEDRSWRRWFRPEFLGWVGSDVIGFGSLTTSMNQVQISHAPTGDLAGPPAEIQAVVRHGAVPAQTAVPGIPPLVVDMDSYLLDLDVFVLGAQPFESSRLVEGFYMFHRQIDRFFHWSLSTEGGDYFGLEIRNG